MLTKIRELIENLNALDLRYCHWKSNLALTQALSGKTDVDLLVDRAHADSFRTLMGHLYFRPAIASGVASFPSVEHYFALDEESGDLVHVHAYFRVITGESLVKNYRLPIDAMLLENTRQVESIRLPSKSAELVVFIVRMMLKHTSLVELLMLARDWKQVKSEILWLLDGGQIEEAIKLVDYWLPAVDRTLFSECIQAIKVPAPPLSTRPTWPSVARLPSNLCAAFPPWGRAERRWKIFDHGIPARHPITKRRFAPVGRCCN